MFKEHPRGLIVAFFANMGERFGFYTMMAILVLFLQAKYGLTEEKAGSIYSWFYFSIYALALIGGLLADFTKRYKTVILVGIVVMFAGYGIMAIPGLSLTITVIGLFTIALGNGLFKGNLQAVVGQLYDNPKYSSLRDSAFMIFYMGINVGAFLAPFAATGIRDWMLKSNGFLHDASLPAQCHQLLNGTLKDVDSFTALANSVNLNGPVTNINQFASAYLDVFARGYNYAFGIAAGAMVISLLVYIFFNRLLPDKYGKTQSTTVTKAPEVKMPWSEEKPRMIALGLVFIVVIFFWMSFHQNGLTLTFFARDYTVKQVGPFTNLFFSFQSIVAVIGAVVGAFLLLGKNKKLNTRLIGGALLVAGSAISYYFFSRNSDQNAIAPEVFQSFNPLFIVSLTFVVMGFFALLRKKNMEPSTPKKIGFGMIIAAVGFLFVMLPSFNLISPSVLNGAPVPDSSRVTPYWLINSYLILTVAELFLSPMGLSFVSKVAPPRFQGLMQGGWLLATALGNKLLFVGSYFWNRIELWQLWAIFIVCCLLSAAFIFSIMKRLEKVAG
jgi:POT family proton-dependent oligopeptide transporter